MLSKQAGVGIDVPQAVKIYRQAIYDSIQTANDLAQVV
jgi:sRNA-binding carbon storage regulator CsrA